MTGITTAGRLVILGLGPGDAALRTHQVEAALRQATDLVGYGAYLDRIGEESAAIRHASDNGEELDRAGFALRLAASGRHVAVVSSGDAGVFAMASAVFEAIEHGDALWRELDVEVMPGVSAMLAAAARIGAPLGHDFCVLSLSDRLKPWTLALRRLRACAEAGLALALYNPVSNARRWQLDAAFSLLREILPDATPVMFATAISRPEERVVVTDLATAHGGQADMRTLVLVGTAATRKIVRPGARPWLYAPRGAIIGAEEA